MHAHASETGGIVRRNVVWTSRRNLEALRLTSGVGMTEWQSARMVPNEDELVAALNVGTGTLDVSVCLGLWLRCWRQGFKSACGVESRGGEGGMSA